MKGGRDKGEGQERGRGGVPFYCMYNNLYVRRKAWHVYDEASAIHVLC